MSGRPWRDEETLRELYHERGMSQAEVAEELGTHGPVISRWMDKHDIPIKDARGRGDLTGSDTPATFETKAAREDAPSYEFSRDSSGNGSMLLRIHRLVAVSEYGFDPVKDMDVHHKNEIPWDNRPENLELLTHSEHMQHHHSQDM